MWLYCAVCNMPLAVSASEWNFCALLFYPLFHFGPSPRFWADISEATEVKCQIWRPSAWFCMTLLLYMQFRAPDLQFRPQSGIFVHAFFIPFWPDRTFWPLFSSHQQFSGPICTSSVRFCDSSRHFHVMYCSSWQFF